MAAAARRPWLAPMAVMPTMAWPLAAILVLYPQAIASPAQPRNPEGGWDWRAYTGADYALKSAPQRTAIMAMVHQITAAP